MGQGAGLRGASGQPAAPPYSNGPYIWDQHLTLSGGLSGANTGGNIYYVDRNVGSTGNGSSWSEAFLTITEAISAVNADYTAGTRNDYIFINEGWYAELPQTLTASDVHIIAVSSGFHDSTVLYGVPVAGVFSGVAGAPALTVTGSNNTIYGLGVFTSDVLYAGIRNGANASDPDGPSASAPTGNAFINCSFVRDVADGELGGLDDLGADGTLIDSCFFSTSCKDWGVRIRSNGVVNPVNSVVRNCRFVGTPAGVQQDAGHNSLIENNDFYDDTSDRPDVVDTPIVITASSAMCRNNYAMTNKADLITGAGTINDIGNWGSDSST